MRSYQTYIDQIITLLKKIGFLIKDLDMINDETKYKQKILLTKIANEFKLPLI